MALDDDSDGTAQNPTSDPTSETTTETTTDTADTVETAEMVVRGYLRRNPDFLARNPDLATLLAPPEPRFGDNVVDMQHYVVERLRIEVDHLTSTQGDLIAATRSNMSSQNQVHEAALAAMDAENLEHLVHLVTQEFRDILDIDVVSLCVEWQGTPPEGLVAGGAFVLAEGAVDALIGNERGILLRGGARSDEAVYGPAAALVRSDALVRAAARDGGLRALLAFGSREEGRFHPGQGTELLGFLGHTVGRCLNQWLNRWLESAAAR